MAQASRDRRAKRSSSTTSRGGAIGADAAIGMAATDGVSGVELTRLGSDVGELERLLLLFDQGTQVFRTFT